MFTSLSIFLSKQETRELINELRLGLEHWDKVRDGNYIELEKRPTGFFIKKQQLAADDVLLCRLDDDDLIESLPIKLINNLKADEVVTVSDLIKRTEGDILRTPNVSKKGLLEIKSFLKTYGLELKK